MYFVYLLFKVFLVCIRPCKTKTETFILVISVNIYFCNYCSILLNIILNGKYISSFITLQVYLFILRGWLFDHRIILHQAASSHYMCIYCTVSRHDVHLVNKPSLYIHIYISYSIH